MAASAMGNGARAGGQRPPRTIVARIQAFRERLDDPVVAAPTCVAPLSRSRLQQLVARPDTPDRAMPCFSAARARAARRVVGPERARTWLFRH